MWYMGNSVIMLFTKACVVISMFALVEMGEHHDVTDWPRPQGLHAKLSYFYRNGEPSHGVFSEDADLPA